MVKKNNNNKYCIVRGCNNQLHYKKNVRIHSTYCGEHNRLVKKLELLRIKCFGYGCKNPADADGYCDGCRPFAANDVPILLGRLNSDDITLIKINTPRCPFTGKQGRGGTPYSIESREQMTKIRDLMMKIPQKPSL